MTVAYICDRKASCRKELGCVANGGACTHTLEIEHAVNFVNVCTSDDPQYIEKGVRSDGDRTT